MRTFMVILCLLFCAMCIALCLPPPSWGQIVGAYGWQVVEVGTNEIWVDEGEALANAVDAAVKNSVIMIRPGTYAVDKLNLDVQARYSGTVDDPWAVTWTGVDTLWSANSLPNGDTLTFEYITFKTTGSGDWARLGTAKYFNFRHCNLICSTAVIIADGDTVVWEDMQLYPLQHKGLQTSGTTGYLLGHNVRIDRHWQHMLGSLYGIYLNGGYVEFSDFWAYTDCTTVLIDAGAMGILGNECWLYGGGGVSQRNIPAVWVNAGSFDMEGGTIVNLDSTLNSGTVRVSGTGAVILNEVTMKNKSTADTAYAYYSSSSAKSLLIDCIYQGGTGIVDNRVFGAADKKIGWQTIYDKNGQRSLVSMESDSARFGLLGTPFKQEFFGEGRFDGSNTLDTITVDALGKAITTLTTNFLLFTQSREDGSLGEKVETYTPTITATFDSIKVQRQGTANTADWDYNWWIIGY